MDSIKYKLLLLANSLANRSDFLQEIYQSHDATLHCWGQFSARCYRVYRPVKFLRVQFQEVLFR